uniref:Uncharacterized protein n=1 Tax=Arundo donax TaxID=35708 RepID=A0A0A9HQF0_ARUDO
MVQLPFALARSNCRSPARAPAIGPLRAVVACDASCALLSHRTEYGRSYPLNSRPRMDRQLEVSTQSCPR